MYSLLTEFRDGDNVVTTMLEHNSNYVPWHALAREILPRLGRRVECRQARFDPVSGELDVSHLASLVDARTKLVCCSGTSNFLGSRPDLATVRAIARSSRHQQPDGDRGSRLLVDGAQLALRDHVAAVQERQRGPQQPRPGVQHADVDLALTPRRPVYFRTGRPLRRADVQAAMRNIASWNEALTARALDGLAAVRGITIYGPPDPAHRTSLVAFNIAGRDPLGLAADLDRAGVEARAGGHCATLAHHALGLTPPASCRLSFYLYNTPAEVDQAVAAVAASASGRARTATPAPA
jgi:selenocysteine lyase/cysteine desulfurase